jgi:hypothetical protein
MIKKAMAMESKELDLSSYSTCSLCVAEASQLIIEGLGENHK